SRVPEPEASGGAVLRLSHAEPGAEVNLPFETAARGGFEILLVGVVGPDQGDFALWLDGAALADWHGYDPQSAIRRGDPVPLVMECHNRCSLGHASSSWGRCFRRWNCCCCCCRRCRHYCSTIRSSFPIPRWSS